MRFESVIIVTIITACEPATWQVHALDSALYPTDQDGDGWTEEEDCDDGDALVHPGAIEVCDERDNDCDDAIDEDVGTTWYADSDSDGYGDPNASFVSCDMPSGYVPTATDCDDNSADNWPGAPERCDHEDNDCDGEIDEDLTSTWYADDDRDGHGNAGRTLDDCDPGEGWVESSDDCDDDDITIHPEATEVCDLIDNDCDDQIDEDVREVFYADFDEDGFGNPDDTTEACEPPSGYIALLPGALFDCADDHPEVHPEAEEICDGLDNDCDEDIDDDDSGTVDLDTWYLDYDGDGYGTDRLTIEACDPPSGFVSSDDDCDDTTADVRPDPAGGCALGLTCLDILEAGRDDGDGDYTIDPDGWDTDLPPFDVYCDMEGDDPGWTEIAYTSDLSMEQHFVSGNTWQSLTDDFELELSDDQIDAIRAVSTEGKQKYEGRCEGVVHYYHRDRGSYTGAFGFILHDGSSTPYGDEDYSPFTIDIPEDGCKTNGGEGGSRHDATWFRIQDTGVPIINLYTYDPGDSGEEFGSPLTDNSAWLR